MGIQQEQDQLAEEEGILCNDGCREDGFVQQYTRAKNNQQL